MRSVGLFTGRLVGLGEALSAQWRKLMDVLIALSFVVTAFLILANEALPWPLVGAFSAMHLVGLFVEGLRGAGAVESSRPS